MNVRFTPIESYRRVGYAAVAGLQNRFLRPDLNFEGVERDAAVYFEAFLDRMPGDVQMDDIPKGPHHLLRMFVNFCQIVRGGRIFNEQAMGFAEPTQRRGLSRERLFDAFERQLGLTAFPMFGVDGKNSHDALSPDAPLELGWLHLFGINMNAIRVDGMVIAGSRLKRCIFKGGEFVGIDARRTSFENCVLDDAAFMGGTMAEAGFASSSAYGTVFDSVAFDRALLGGLFYNDETMFEGNTAERNREFFGERAKFMEVRTRSLVYGRSDPSRWPAPVVKGDRSVTPIEYGVSVPDMGIYHGNALPGQVLQFLPRAALAMTA